jgi:parallel beta-helix repeat protein
MLALFITLSVTPLYAVPFTVDNWDDSGPGSLRAAIASADSYDDVIRFNVKGTITLSSQLEIRNGMKIQGPGADLLSVSGGGECRVFYIEDIVESVDIFGISIVSGDVDKYDLSQGGGIYNLSDNLTVSNCHFCGNHASFGGGMYNLISSPEVTNCTFTSNIVTEDGGGIYNSGSSPTLTNCTFYSNSASDGGAIYEEWYNGKSSSSKVTNCTFYLTSASNGGGMYNEDSFPTVKNCIFWDISSSEIYHSLVDLPFPAKIEVDFCIVRNNNVVNVILSNSISTDPKLQYLADNGGPTWTCALDPGSSAIDAGTEIEAPTTDQREVPRPYDGGSFDIGAYEYGVKFCEIIADSTNGGSIIPAEAHLLAGIEEEVFYFQPDEAYHIHGVYVDSNPVSYDELNSSYTFQNLSDDHIILAVFLPNEKDDNDDDDDSGDDVNGGGGGVGCNISALPGIALLLVLPLLFLSGKMK